MQQNIQQNMQQNMQHNMQHNIQHNIPNGLIEHVKPSVMNVHAFQPVPSPQNYFPNINSNLAPSHKNFQLIYAQNSNR